MSRHYPLKILISLVVVVACAYGCYQRIITSYALPFFVVMAGAHSVVIKSLPFHLLPAGLHSGDELDLQAMSMKARYAVMPRHYFPTGMGIPAERAYMLSVKRGDAPAFSFPVTTAVAPASWLIRQLYRWISLVTIVVLSGMVMLVLWRGRGRAAAWFTLWSLGALCGTALELVSADVYPGIILLLMSSICSLLSGIGLYCLVESTVGATLSLRTRWLWRGLFIVVLATGTLTSQIIGPALFVAMGWTGLLGRSFQIVWATSFLVPILMLFVSSRLVGTGQRMQLRWMLWSGALLVAAVLVNYAQVLSIASALIVGGVLYLLAMFGFLYAVLRHRVVNVSVFIDRTLVYGSVTALVVGILAAVNSVVEHAALGTSASLLLQVVVPLALGIVLGQARRYADKIVERVFFRKKYLAAKALRHFARHSSGYDRADALVSAATQIIHEKAGTPGVAVYIRRADDYALASHTGQTGYAANLSGNDAALAAARSGAREIDLSELHSTLGNDGYVFPLGPQAVLVCANRPGEHYAAEDRKLLAYVAGKVGIALQTLRIQEKIAWLETKAGLVDALASGKLAVSAEIQAMARQIATTPAAF